MYQDRSIYRNWVNNNTLVSFKVAIEETDLLISAEKDLTEKSYSLISKYRNDLCDFISSHTDFKEALIPLDLQSDNELINIMIKSSQIANVGPMAAVAGAINDMLGDNLKLFTKELIIENGGDILIISNTEKNIGIYAGDKSPYSGKLGIKVKPETQLGISTSSGTVGHSLSFGKADSVTVLCKTCALSDAYATAICNMIKSESDVNSVLNYAKMQKDILGCLITFKETMGAFGDLELIAI